MATFAVERRRFGTAHAVTGTVTWDGSATSFDTGLSHVDYVNIHCTDAEVTNNTWYKNYSDNGSTAKEGAVGFASAPTDTHVYEYFAVGKG
jgi:hypothetical protein